MMPSRMAERLRIGKVRMTGPWRSALAGWGVMPSAIGRLALIPNDLFMPDPSFLREVSDGLFGLGGHAVTVGRGSPFAITTAEPHWLADLHGFSWLGHLRADGNPRAVEFARRVVADWIGRHRTPQGLPWRPVVLANRITAWLVNATLLLDDAEPAQYRAVLRSLGRQIRRLDATRHEAAPGVDRAMCAIALVKAALAIEAAERHVTRLEGELQAELGRQIGPDGSHISRNPSDGLDILVQLLPLRGLYRAIGCEPQALAEVTDRLFRFLEHMRLGDGTLARFNGMGPNRPDTLGAVVAFDRHRDAVGSVETLGGYARLASGEAIVLVDVGRPPPLEYASAAHAGCLSFEMSWGATSILRNCGAPAAGFHQGGHAPRSTASHNTLALDARSSARLVESAGLEQLLGAQPLRGPAEVAAAVRDDGAGITLEARHDGYVADTAILHERHLTLARDGRRLEGTDRLGGRSGVLRLPLDLPFAIHFHLGPDVGARSHADGQAALLELGSADPAWTFEVTGARLTIEASTDWADIAGPRPGRQIVLRGTCPGETTVSWSLTAVDRPHDSPVEIVATATARVSPGDQSC